MRAPQAGRGLIGDLVWADANGDGTRQSYEPVLIGASVCATPMAAGSPICATTDNNGRYLIEALAGQYSVAPQRPAGGWVSTPSRLTVNLVAGQQQLDVDFGFNGGTVTLGGIGGTVWQDLRSTLSRTAFTSLPGAWYPWSELNVIKDMNGDGAWDDGEPYLATFTTAGNYLFEGLPAGAFWSA